MVSAKLVFAFILAIGASQAAMIKPQPRYLNTVLLDIIKIGEIIMTRVESGIEEADPLIQEIQDEVSDKLAAQVGKLRDDLKQLVVNVTTRFRTLNNEVSGALDTMDKTIRPCLDAAEPPIDAQLTIVEDKISDIITKVKGDNQDDLTDLKQGIDSLTLRLDGVIDKAIADALVCVKPGSKGVKACLDDTTWTLIGALKGLLAELALILVQAQDVVGTVVGQALNATRPLFNETLDAIAPQLETFGTCVENTKPVRLY